MTEPNEVKVEDAETEQDTPEEELTPETDWEAEAKKARGIAQRLRTKLVKATEKKVEQPAQKEKQTKTGFGYDEKAFLKVSGIQPNEYDLILEVMQATGKSLDDVVDSKYVQAELKERRATQATKEAVPSGTKRSTTSPRDSVDYWIAKGELPPWEQRELRQKVVQAKIDSEKNKSQFTDNPVV